MPVVLLGNSNALDAGTPLPGQRVTTAHVPDNHTADEAFRAVADPGGLWAAHSANPAPDWVQSDDPELQARLAAHYGCPAEPPPGWGSEPDAADAEAAR